jgi:L-amino acid N-acyltransferase YncA
MSDEINAAVAPAGPARVEPMTAEHAAQVLAIYQAGIDEGDATFETRAPGIFPENGASVGLHLAAGFTIVGRRERLARQHGRWRDVLLLERRSPIIE